MELKFARIIIQTLQVHVTMDGNDIKGLQRLQTFAKAYKNYNDKG